MSTNPGFTVTDLDQEARDSIAIAERVTGATHRHHKYIASIYHYVISVWSRYPDTTDAVVQAVRLLRAAAAAPPPDGDERDLAALARLHIHGAAQVARIEGR